MFLQIQGDAPQNITEGNILAASGDSYSKQEAIKQHIMETASNSLGIRLNHDQIVSDSEFNS